MGQSMRTSRLLGSSTAMLEIRYRRMLVRLPIGKQKEYPELILTAIHAREQAVPNDRERIDWKPLTDLPVRSRRDAVEKLNWYDRRRQSFFAGKIVVKGAFRNVHSGHNFGKHHFSPEN